MIYYSELYIVLNLCTGCNSLFICWYTIEAMSRITFIVLFRNKQDNLINRGCYKDNFIILLQPSTS